MTPPDRVPALSTLLLAGLISTTLCPVAGCRSGAPEPTRDPTFAEVVQFPLPRVIFAATRPGTILFAADDGAYIEVKSREGEMLVVSGMAAAELAREGVIQGPEEVLPPQGSSLGLPVRLQASEDGTLQRRLLETFLPRYTH